MNKKWYWMIGLLCVGLLIGTIQAAAGQEDPLISLSYLERRLTELNHELKALIFQNPSNPGNPGVIAPVTWQVITLEKGERLIVEGGCELILRAGEAYAIASVAGGLSDLTAGCDLATGAEVIMNHHLLVPKSDGRGLNIQYFSYVMIKGEYVIQPTP